MAYCKHCGMDSPDPDKCQWCGRSLVPAPPPPAAPDSRLPPLRPSTWELVEQEEENARKGRTGFIISCCAMLILAACIIACKWWLYPWITIGGLFAAGMMLGGFGVIPSSFDEWQDFLVPGLLLVFFPAAIVCIGYVAYGLINRDVNFTVVWLLGVYVVALTVMEGATFLGFAIHDQLIALWRLRGVEILGMLMIILGWICSGAVRPVNR